MATNNQSESALPVPGNNNSRKTSDLLPRFYKTDSNKKFFSATLDQLVQPGTVKKVSGYIGRQNAKSVVASDVFIRASDTTRQNYQLEPAAVIQDYLGNVNFFKDYIDHINHVKVFGGNVDNHERLNKQEFYAWNPNIDWDKFVNFQQYYWLPYGPTPIEVAGQQLAIESTFTVVAEDNGDNYAYLFTPDGLTRNPTITLFRGQTYKFDIDALHNPFAIKTQRVAGTLDRFTEGVTGNGTEQGTLTFVVGIDTPDVLYYVNEADANTGGTFQIKDIDENTFLNVGADILGKKSYTLSTGTALSNGMKLFFSGNVSPEIYSSGYWYVEGVGTTIKLVSEVDLEISGTYTEETALLFDDNPFDLDPFSTITNTPKEKDYIVINRSSPDRNPWSRYNRWFHKDVITASAESAGQFPEFDQTARANRPIIEFSAGLKLYNFGHQAKKNVDLIDNFTTDVFSTIEGSLGYNIDGVDVVNNMRILFTADPDRLVNGRIFKVNFIEVTVPNRQFNFNAVTGINLTTKVITTSTVHGLTTGNQVIYLNNGELNINGLTHRKVYYVRVVNDTDIQLYTNKLLSVEANIFDVGIGTHSFEVFTGLRRQINLVEEADSAPLENETILVNLGQVEELIPNSLYGNRGMMYWYNGTKWKLGPIKSTVNQQPLFDIFDPNGYSYSDTTIYDGSSFRGTKVFSYKVGTGTNDAVLGFPLSYQNINNVGDIQFEFNLLKDSFTYKDVADVLSKTTSVGYLKLINALTTYSYENGWKTSLIDNIQPVVRIFKEEYRTLFDGSKNLIVNNFPVDVFDFKDQLTDLEIKVYVNGRRQNKDSFTVINGPTYKTVVLTTDVTNADVVTLKCYAKQLKNDKGYYETPISLQNNPLNNDVTQFTLGEVIDHVDTIVDNITTFSGTYPGDGNLRDIGNLTPYGARFVQHSAPLNFSLYHLGSQTSNMFKSLEQARDDYGKFKRAFITYASNAGIDTDPRPFVDIILTELAKDKPKTSPYYLSDMFGYSGSKRLEYTVLDGRIKTYPLTSAFNLALLSNKAVGVYLNGNQLLHGRDYTFGTDVFFTILVELVEDDLIEVYEYESTDGTFCPPTPTKLGLYPLFEPKIYTDDTYLEPTTVIQGHDGSITIAYDDYRDDLILELEMRIFNNIKISYNSDIFNIYDFIPGYSRTTEYSKFETDNVLGQFFFQWTANVNQDFTQPNIDLWSRLNPFTFNYRGNFAPNGTDIPGFWRGVYRWMLDTDRPHTHPWECLGFSIEPTWWQDVYGTVPYTSDNYVLWEDIRQGIIRQPGVPIRILEKFAKPILSSGKPVDEDGNLISPLYASYANGPIKETAEGSWVFGDQAPVETAWRRSSYYPFALMQTALLLHPNKVLGSTFDRSRIVRNLSNQLIYKDTGRRIRLEDLAVTSTALSSTRVYTAGLVNYLVDYLTSDTTALLDQYADDLQSLTTKIAAKLGGFTSKAKFKLILDSKNPSSSGGVFIPEENYNIFLNTSSPTNRLAYSGVVITKYADGYEIRGYIKDQPYFVYYPYQQNERVINVGGISESFINWESDKYYTAGKLVRYNNQYFRVKITHQSTTEFDPDYFTRLAALPVTGGREAIIRKSWDKNTKITISYGTKFKQIQEVVDFLQGYGAYLQEQGFVFDEYNQNLKAVDSWETSVKEFLFWSTQNWAVGSALAVSPSARYMLVKSDTAVVDNIQNSFYGYKVYRVDGEKIDPEFTNTYREENEFSLSPQNTNHGLYGAVLHTVQKEHVLILDNVTQFNDIIYDQAPGYRQERIKILGYVSANWNGSFNVPGFIFDTARIADWTQWSDYNLGDIVKYKEFYYSAKSFLPGVAEFDNSSWVLLEEKPTAQLLPNWDYRAEQFTDFYDLDSDNFDSEQQKMAQHLIGYQKRQYLENIIQDDLSQYKFYQGMISEKGTQNVFNKLFDVLSADGQESLTFNEEWAVRVGAYGATDSYKEIEFKLDESLFKLNPQPIELTSTINPSIVDFVYRQVPTDIVVKPVGYNNEPWPVEGTEQYLRTPGYVRYEDVKLNVDSLEDVIAYDISTFEEGDYIWCAFENKLNSFNDYWNVYRFTKNTFGIADVEYASGTLTLQCDRTPNVAAGDIIGIENATAIQGFYTVASIVNKNIIIKTTIKDWTSPFTDSSEILTYKFIRSRIDNANNINDLLPPKIKAGELIWADNNGNGLKTVYENNKVYGQKSLSKASPILPNVNFGKKVAMSENGKTAAVADNNKVTIFVKNSLGNWLEQDIMTADFESSVTTIARSTASGTNIITADDTYSFELNDPVMFSGVTVGSIISGRTYFVKTKPSNVTFTISETPGGPTFELTSGSIEMNVHLKLEYGTEMCFSPDAEWLAIAAPRASNVRSAWRGDYDGGHEYNAGDVVQLRTNFTTERSLNSHWTARGNIPAADWSTINSFSQDWAATDLITVNKQFSGAEYPTTGYENLGYVDLYRRSSSTGSYDLAHSFVSPNPTQGERFGSKMVMAQSGSEYVLAVTSPGTDTESVDSTVVQGRVYMYRYGTGAGDDSSVRWQMDYDRNYQGAFDSSRSYLQGDIVFYDYNLYECVGNTDFQNPAPDQSSLWSPVTKSNILGYFPQESSLFDVNNNDLTLAALEGQTIESVQPGDKFGAAIDMSSDGQTLIISAPGADQDTYENYKGPFRTSLKYFENDVVYYNGYYYKFNQTASADPIISFNTTHWDKVSTETRSINSGKVFIYTYNGVGYELTQTLTSDNVDIEREDQFGESIAVSATGGYIAVGTSLYDSDKRDAGRVIIFKKGTTYTKNQLLYSYTKETFERFGAFVDFMNDDETLVVFSGNGDVERVTTFDLGKLTIDNDTLRIADLQVDTGRVDIFDKYNENYIYGESLDTSVTNDDTDRYGASIAVGNNNIYVSSQRDDGSTSTFVQREGKVYAYYKLANATSWSVLHQEVKKPNVRKIKKSYLYNTTTSKLISYLDVVDPIQGKIPGPADQEIRFKTYFDPAVYSVGTSAVNVDVGMNWTKSQVGMLWWDLTRAKFLDNQIGETIYRSTTWNRLYETASIDIYEWVESKFLPADWDILSGTDKGTAAGISGTSKYGSAVYSVKKRYDNVSKTFINTYYYWVKNPTITPNVLDRKLSAFNVSNLIADPTGQNYSCIALTGANTFSLINATSLIEGTSSNLNIQYWIVDADYTQQNAHSQWKIISENLNTVIPREIEKKWVDSLVGKDAFDRVVPDPSLPIKQQYGILFRPRQSMFVNRTEALKQYIERVNSVLATRLIADDYDTSNLLLVDPSPSPVLGLWDSSVDTEAELRFIGTANLRAAILEPIIIDGRVFGVTIIDSGYGYINAPYLHITGQGKNANVKTIINATGQVTGIEIINKGEGYLDNTIFEIRPFSALVLSDSTTFDKWSIYEWNSATVTWERTRSQGYDVTKYWSYQDWYSAGYNQFTKIDHVVENTYELATLDVEINQIVKVNNIGTGGWLLLEKYANIATIDYTENYKVIGRQNGTIKFSSSLYNFSNSIIGYGSDLYDSTYYDNLAVKELRIIIDTIKTKILVDDLKVEYLKLFFSSVRYALQEQAFVDWAFKTSFVKATHNVGDLKQKVTYNSDNLESFEDYVNEVKPYRTQVREYISSYSKVDPNPNSVTDFDLPPLINENFTVDPLTVKISPTGAIESGYAVLQQYPWKHWYDHVGFKITTIEIVDGGSGYIDNPVVRINGGFGTGAVAKAYISNGKVNRIQLVNSGTGFLKAPEIVIDGGLAVDGVQARAVAIIESEVVRANKISIKFDRTSKTYFVSEITETETFVGTGSRLQFALKFSPLTKIGTSSVKLYQVGLDPDNATVTGVDVLREDYTLTSKKSTAKGYTSYSGLLTLATAPAVGETIRITYTKDFNHLSATDRIKFYYNPTTGMLGKDADDFYAQLMTGVDYGGVSLTGLGFNIGGGWDTLPFFTDSWDGFDADFDDYIKVVGSDSDAHYEHQLPYTPTAGTILNVYVNEQRIDDPYFDLYDGSTVQPNGRKVAPAGAVMKTITASGTTDIFYLPNNSDGTYLDINEGDRIIFRKNTSDGSITPRPEEYDTQLSGGNLAYTTATGLATDDINIDGDGFVTAMTSNAPEEVVPGQIVDTVAIKVFQLPTSGSSKILFKNYIGNGSNTEFSLAQIPLQSASVFVKLDNLILTQGVDYIINWAQKKVVLSVAPANKKIVSVITFSIASEFLLDTNYFVSDGSTLEYITNAPWSNDDSTAFGSIVLVNGATVAYELFRTDNSYARPNCVGINLTAVPAVDALITYMITSDANSSASVIKTEELAVDGSTRVFDIVNPVGLALPYENNILVLVDGEILIPSMTEYFTMKDNSLTYNLAKFKSEPFVINPVDCKVYIDGELLSYSSQYVFDLSVVSITLDPSVYNEGSVLAIVNYRDSEYTIDNDSTVAQITFATAPLANSTVEVVTFYNHNVENIIRTNEFVGVTSSLDIDTPDYYRYHSLAGNQLELFKSVKFDDYIWVIKNNQMLTHSVDYHLNSNLRSITLAVPLINSDVLDIVLFSDDHITQGYGWMQFKDMLNRTHYKRISKAKSTRLAADLGQFDIQITVEDGSTLAPPNPTLNLPGVVEILGERIEYMSKVGNTLSRLRRGTLGTGVKTTYVAGTLVQDIGPTETIPYADQTIVKKGDPIDTPQLYTNGTLELPYVPNINDIEVFVAGRRLKKSSYQLFQQEAIRQGKLDATLASNDKDYPDSSEGDITFAAEFAVNGTSTLQLTELPLILLEDSSENKFEVIVVKKIGQVWEDPGRTLQQSNGAVAKFLKDTETNFPEYPVE